METTLNNYDFSQDMLDKYYDLKSAVEDYLYSLECRLATIHEIRCVAYHEAGVKLPESWGYVGSRLGNDNHIFRNSITFNEVCDGAVEMISERSYYDSSDTYNLTPIPLLMLMKDNTDIWEYYRAEAKQMKVEQDAKESANKQREINRRLAEIARMQDEIAKFETLK